MAVEDELADRGYHPVKDKRLAAAVLQSGVKRETTDAGGTRWWLADSLVDGVVVWVEKWVLDVVAACSKDYADAGEFFASLNLSGSADDEERLRACDSVFRARGVEGLVAYLGEVGKP